MQKTKLQIIDETVAYYAKDPSRRAISEYGSCMYVLDGRFCGHSMWIRPEMREEIENSEHCTAEYAIDHFGDEIHVPEARGHSSKFWKDIQKLHDNCSNWSKTGLTNKGQLLVDHLKDIYK